MLNSDLLFLFLFFVLLSGLVAIADFLRRNLGMPPETTRKFVHIATGIVVVFTPFVLHSMWPMVILGTLFAIVDFLGVRFQWFHGMHATSRASLGTVYYPLSFVVLVLLFWQNAPIIIISSMLIMAIADALAAIVGEKWGKSILFNFRLEKKSLPGSATMLVSSIVIVFGCLWLGKAILPGWLSLPTIILIAIITGFVAAASEMISLNGSDNLTVPLGSAFVLNYLLFHTPADLERFALGMGMSLLIALLSWRVRFLTVTGAVGAFLLGSLVYGMGGWMFTVPILTFFFLSSLISKMGKRKKAKLVHIFEKSGERDIWQVLANGGIPGLLVILWGYTPSPLWYVMYIAALAAVMADTWGTEIGVLSRYKPISVISFKPVPMGTSGGITLAGTLGGLLGAAILVASAMLTVDRNQLSLTFDMGIILLVSAFVASLIDSLLGATLQAKYKCGVCDKITEKQIHCEQPTQHVHGYLWMNNDLVNVLCGFSGVIVILFSWLAGWI